MTLVSELQSLAGELDRINSKCDFYSDTDLPDFVTAKSGVQRHFSNEARASIRRVAEIIHLNRSAGLVRIEIDPFEGVVRQTIADMHAEGAFSSLVADSDISVLATLRERIETSLTERGNEYTHHIPAWTQGIERETAFILGPVKFSSRDAWIDQVDFPPQAKNKIGNDSEANHRWKERLRDALDKAVNRESLPPLAASIYDVVRPCPAVLSVTVNGYEKDFSGKLARIVCKAALDATSLCLQNSDFFRQQALYDERLPPFSTSGIIEQNGFLRLPGRKLQRMPVLPPEYMENARTRFGQFQAPIGSILEALLNPSSHTQPQLASRWATALDWLGEGCREPSDSVALAKLGTSLDVLSCGGKYRGILGMVSHLTGLDEDKQVISDPPMTLAKVIKDIYDRGRSQILHGSHHDRLKPFSKERSYATQIANAILLEAALRLSGFSGADKDDAFRTMPK